MTQPSQRRSLWRQIGQWAVMATVLVVFISIFQYDIRGWPPLPMVAREVTLGFLVCLSIFGLAMTLMPRLGRRIWGYRAVLRWAILAVAMMFCGAAGLALAVTLLSLAGILPSRLLLIVFRENIVGVLSVTLVIGVAFTIFGSTQQRLQATEAELRAQQLERERAEKVAAEARLASLSSRVQPHFLFNTLNSISALVREDPVQAEQTIARLSSLLRSSLDGKEAVPLEQELKLVTDYLGIQQTRLGERLRYTVDSAPPESPPVPPFSIQTLVENSVRHAGETRAGGVELQVTARRSGLHLIVEVADNGPGFQEDAITEGHGLDTLTGRLRALYGDRAGLEFTRLSSGMAVRMRIPLA